jgi:hypothetical protein
MTASFYVIYNSYTCTVLLFNNKKECLYLSINPWKYYGTLSFNLGSRWRCVFGFKPGLSKKVSQFLLGMKLDGIQTGSDK